MKFFVLFFLIGLAGLISCLQDFDHDGLHPVMRVTPSKATEEQNGNYWNDKGQSILQNRLKIQQNTNVAKNVIMFLGDGMSVPTLAATRSYQGEISGVQASEGTHLSFEEFDFSGLSMTYCVDTKVADSACSATAYLGGVKGNIATIGVDGNVLKNDCEAQANTDYHVTSIGKWAQDAGKMTGVVTNARITHASPSGAYAHIASRDWENDAQVKSSGGDPAVCPDIATQLIMNEPGKNFNVIFGGGRPNFFPRSEKDPESGYGSRTDGVNLINAWIEDKTARNLDFTYAWNRDQLYSRSENATHVLGLFAKDHLDYRLDNNTNQPSVSEMTEEAIKILQKSETGYFLFVEGGRIDMAHHETRARVALDETVEFSDAIRKALEMTDPSETLIVVTADHAHTMSFSGYAERSLSILENYAGIAIDGRPYTSLNYANGPGYKSPRPVPTEEQLRDYNQKFPAGVPLVSETHGGDDVAVFAKGPWSHLFSGSFEQNFIPHAMAYASCVGKGITACSDNKV